MIRVYFLAILLLVVSYSLHAQKDTWVIINNGFAKCAEIGQSAGIATWQSDDFRVDKLIHLRGEMYALIRYGSNGTNTSGCADGFFRHDTLSNNWIKVAEKPHPSLAAMISNGTSIYALADGWVYEFTTDYATYPTGWKSLTATNLKYQDIFNNSCKGTGGNGYHFQEPADAIGDTIYTFMQSDVTGCWNSNVMGKFNTVSHTWTYDRVGAFPHQMANADVQDYRICFADRIGGIFTYFLTYGRWGMDKCIPNYLYVWDPRPGPNRGWRNVSQGVNWRNMTGNSNPEQCVDPTRAAIGWGPNGGWTPSWDRRDIYASSETGVYRWEGDKFYYIADYWGNAAIYPTANGIFTLVMGEIMKLNPTTYVPVGKLFEVGCLHNAPRRLTTPDNGNSLYVVKEGMKDPYVCDWRESRSATLAIARLKFDADKPAKARNLHVETATYIGGPGDNTPVGTGVAGEHHVFVAGNFNQVKAPKPFVVKNFMIGSPGSRGRIIHMNTFGDTILSVTNLGNVVYDYEVQNFGKYEMVVSGDFGVAVLDSSSMNLKWSIPANQLWDSGEINVDIDDNGRVVVLRNKQFKVFDANGASLSGLVTLTDNFVNDITIKGDNVYVVGFNNGTLNGDDCAGNVGGSGLPVQSAFLKAYVLSGGALNFNFKTFGFPGSDLGKDEADTRGYRINIGKDGKLYFLGEAAGGNSVFRWNGKETIFTNGCQNPKSKLVSYDLYSSPVNTKDAHIAFFCTINPTTGEVERGQYVIPRLPAGVSNSYRIKEGYIHADQKGYVYIGATSAYAFGGRDIQHMNGILVGKYVGGDMVTLVVNPDYSIRTFWGTFSKDSGSGTIKGFGIRDNIISAVGETGRGLMITGGTVNGNFEKKNALNPDPFNLDMEGTNTINDTYLAVWYQDVWRHAPLDTLEERKNPSEPVIDEQALNNRANFEANIKTACVGGDVTITNTSVGDSLNWIWNFGEGSSLPPNTFGKGPFTLQYTTPGLKSIRLDVLLEGNIKDYHLEHDYINVMPADQTLSSIQGAGQVCSGTTAFYSVEPVFGVEEYIWTVPNGTIILQGQGSAKIEVSLGINPGDITVTAKTPCGFTSTQSLAITLLPGGEQSVILVVGDIALNSNDQNISDKLVSLGYTVTPIADENINEAHGSCAALIVVSASADAELINYKLLNAPVPVISFLSSLYRDLGMTSGSLGTDFGTEANDAVQINSGAHELNDNGALNGSVQVYTSTQSENWGKPGPAGINIATIGGDINKVAIIGYEQGTAMFGLNAPARRVGFYLTSVDFANLTTEGTKLLEQAICWCLYNCPSTTTITTNDVASETYCPGSEIEIPFDAVGTFNAGTIVPTPYTINMDDGDEGVSVNGWDKIYTTSDVSHTIQTFFRRSAVPAINGQYAKYKPTIIYSGTYKVFMHFPREASFSSNTKVEINHANGKTVVDVIQNNSDTGPRELGTFRFEKGTAGDVTIVAKIDGDGPVVTDYLTFESVDLDVLGGNVFTAQLSDREGNFTSPVVIGTLDGTTVAPIQAIIPANTLPGTKYKVRVVSSNPSVKGTVSPTAFEIGGIPSDPLKINGKVLACRGASIQTYSVDKTQGATSYIWDIPLGTHFKDPSLPNETTATTDADAGGGASVEIDFGTATTNNILVYANNACGKSKEPARLLVEMTALPPAKPAAIVGKTIVCKGSVLNETYSISPVQYASKYHWVLSSGLSFVGASDQNSIVVNFDPANEGGTITVSAIGECGEGEPLSLIVSSENCNDALANFSSVNEACTNSPITFTDLSTGATSWSWEFGEGAIPQSISGAGPAKTPPSVIYTTPGTKMVKLTINAGTDYVTDKTIPIEIFASPALPDVIQRTDAGNGIACGLDGAIEYNVPTVAGADSYSWKLPTGATGTSNTNTISINLANSTSGFITVAGVNIKCGTGPVSSYFVQVNTITETPGDITGPEEVCANTEGLAYQVAGLQDATLTYKWQIKAVATNIVTPLSSTDNSTGIDFSNPGEYIVSVLATNGCTESTPVELPVTVGADPGDVTTPIIGKSEICAGATQVGYSIVPVIGAISYTWVLPGNANGSSITNTIAVDFPTPLNGNISVSAILSCGASSPVELPITVQDGVSTPPVFEDPITVLCTDQQDVVYSVAADFDEYQWTLPTGATGTSSSNTITVDFDGAVSGSISVSALYSCGVGVPASITLSSIDGDLALGDISGDNNICKGAGNYDYEIEAVDGITNYVWQLPAGAEGDVTGTIINVNFTDAQSGTLSVKGETVCHTETATKTLPITVLGNAINPSLSGEQTICPGTDQVQYEVGGIPEAEALYYSWTLPVGATAGETSEESIMVDFSNDFLSSSIKAVAVTACNDPVPLTLPITVPEAPAAISEINGAETVCLGSESEYRIDPVEHATEYHWTLPTGATTSDELTDITITIGAGTGLSGQLCVAAVGTCGEEAPLCKPIALHAQLPIGEISGSDKLCKDLAPGYEYEIAEVVGALGYEWTLPSGATTSDPLENRTITIRAVSELTGQLCVSAIGVCGKEEPVCRPLALNILTPISEIRGDNYLCRDHEPGYRYEITPVTGALKYNWTLPNDATSSDLTNGETNNPAITIHAGLNLSGTLCVKAIGECGEGESLCLPLALNSELQLGPITGNDYICKNSESEYSVEPIEGATEYHWTLPIGATSNDTNGNIITIRVGTQLLGDKLCVAAVGVCGEEEPVCLPVALNREPKGTCEIFIPNAFSPNGDGINDVWQISGLGNYKRISLKIFNRWGNLIYDVSNYDSPWDGTLNGKKLSTATYYYVINLDNEEPRRGSVSIIADR